MAYGTVAARRDINRKIVTQMTAGPVPEGLDIGSKIATHNGISPPEADDIFIKRLILKLRIFQNISISHMKSQKSLEDDIC